ncbi:unnamed protein product [Brassica rapa]|uniref:Uncharacterized protein n=1 Tax=Brassica campestris TaxID=3711 RepID=A0A3P6BSC6_BRACM|nr:unnamed protein product [Brassica rapa]VDD05626.1 unnamed protein product [Brassica rapa]
MRTRPQRKKRIAGTGSHRTMIATKATELAGTIDTTQGRVGTPMAKALTPVRTTEEDTSLIMATATTLEIPIIHRATNTQ